MIGSVVFVYARFCNQRYIRPHAQMFRSLEPEVSGVFAAEPPKRTRRQIKGPRTLLYTLAMSIGIGADSEARWKHTQLLLLHSNFSRFPLYTSVSTCNRCRIGQIGRLTAFWLFSILFHVYIYYFHATHRNETDLNLSLRFIIIVLNQFQFLLAADRTFGFCNFA